MTPHPLDPLSPVEIERAAAIVRGQGGLSEAAWFETIALAEPDRNASASLRRCAFVCCYDPVAGETWDGIADLAAGEFLSWQHVKGAQARIVADEFAMGGEIAKADPRFKEACARRGITDLGEVLVEPWAAGHFGIAGEEGERIAYGHCWLRNQAGDNPYARPIANLHPVIDLRRRRLLRIDDGDLVPLPPESTALIHPEPRQDLKPLEITQPEGASFTVEGNSVRWQKWQFRLGFNVREGMTLHAIGYEDGGRLRPIMHRASLAEMVVPYGDPTGSNYRRNAFDIGEFGIGQFLDPLKLGCDCLGHIRYVDVWSHDWFGQPRIISNAICIHEEDFGILWKFSDLARRQTTVRRSRRLVVSTTATIGNYVYGFFWYFYQDGTIGIETKATGVPLVTARRLGEPSSHGALVAPGIDAHIHQHVFSFRFEMAVDGERNSVSEVDFAGAPMGGDNPYGNAVRIIETPLVSEAQAQRLIDIAASRYWRVTNPSVRNALGEPVGYRLVPGANALPFLDPESPVARRAGFMFRHFWATRYAADELYPAGRYPNQHPGGDGLARWTAADRSLDNERIVVWYTLNYHHLPRPEDWPVQPCVYAGFHWMPSGFFDSNPALDVPAP
jgi:primary-amine oxidase